MSSLKTSSGVGSVGAGSSACALEHMWRGPRLAARPTAGRSTAYPAPDDANLKDADSSGHEVTHR